VLDTGEPHEQRGRSVARRCNVIVHRDLVGRTRGSRNCQPCSTEGHGRHRPHVSLMVGEGLILRLHKMHLFVYRNIRFPLQADSVAIFPGGTIVLKRRDVESTH